MNNLKRMSRREFMKMAGIASISLAAGNLISACYPATIKFNPQLEQLASQPLDLHLLLKAISTEVQIFPGKPTQVRTYRADFLEGNKQSLEIIPDSYLGPIMRVKRGQRIKIDFENEISQKSIIHWHGMHVPAEMDGHPKDVISRGEVYPYDFLVDNRAGTYWFHPHPHGKTGPQVYSGLAGLMIVSDDEEQAIGLPSGEFDIPLVIQDRTFDRNNQLVYPLNTMMASMQGFLGDQILVNGFPDYELFVDRGAYRLRILNGSNSRIYKLAWEDGTPITVIATDGGLLQQPVERPYVTLGPAERVELWVDFSHWDSGAKLSLLSLGWYGNRGIGMGSMMREDFASISEETTFPILKVFIRDKTHAKTVLPEKLSKIERLDEADSVNRFNPRRWVFGMNRMAWTINGRTFEMENAANDEIVKLGTQETWIFENENSGMGMMGRMQMAHPVHVHGLQFQVIERQVDRASERIWTSLAEGFIDEGWKDSVLVMPGEKVKVLLRFEDFAGLYLIHCHNLEHEDQGMMRNYRIDL